MDTYEEWRDIPGFVGKYQASSLGYLRSIKTGTIYKTNLITPNKKSTRNTYRKITMYFKGKYTTKWVHSLVALAFLGERPEGMKHIRHLDGDSLNNCANNLIYSTASENFYDRRRHGTDFYVNKTECKYGHPYDEANTIWRFDRGGPGQRECRTCRREHSRNWKKKK